MYNGKTYYPGQGNNSYIFPGVALGVICAGASTIPEDIFLVSAEKLASLVSQNDLDIGSLYPPLETIRDCSMKIATEVMDYAYEKGTIIRPDLARNTTNTRHESDFDFPNLFTGLASVRPEPQNKEEFIKSQTYDLTYPSAIPQVYSWPKL